MHDDSTMRGRAAIEKELHLQANARSIAVSDITWKRNRSNDHSLDFKVNGRRESILFNEQQVEDAPQPKGLDGIRAKVIHALSITPARGKSES